MHTNCHCILRVSYAVILAILLGLLFDGRINKHATTIFCFYLDNKQPDFRCNWVHLTRFGILLISIPTEMRHQISYNSEHHSKGLWIGRKETLMLEIIYAYKLVRHHSGALILFAVLENLWALSISLGFSCDLFFSLVEHDNLGAIITSICWTGTLSFTLIIKLDLLPYVAATKLLFVHAAISPPLQHTHEIESGFCYGNVFLCDKKWICWD